MEETSPEPVLDEPAAPDPVTVLRDLARTLHAAGKNPFETCMALNQQNSRMGSPHPRVADLVRELPELENWNALDAWAAQEPGGIDLVPCEAAAGPLPYPYTREEVLHVKRGRRLAGLLEGHRDQVGPVLADVLRDEIVNLVRATLATDLPGALDFLLARREGDR